MGVLITVETQGVAIELENHNDINRAQFEMQIL